MSRKTKRSEAQVDVPEVTNNKVAEEHQSEDGNQISEESTPATIVEATEAEVFSGQTEKHESVSAGEAESQMIGGPVIETGGEAVQSTPAKKERVSKRPYISLVEEHLELGDLDKKELLALIMEQFPTVSKNGASTFLTDALNPRYSHWKDRVISKTVDGKLIFAEKIEPLPDELETPAETTQPEQPSE